MGSRFSEGEIQRTSILWGKISTSLGSSEGRSCSNQNSYYQYVIMNTGKQVKGNVCDWWEWELVIMENSIAW